MRIKNFTLLTLALFLMSVVAFAQKPNSTQRVLTPKQQILQAYRTGQLTKENASAFKFAKPALPQNMQKSRANKQVLPVTKQAPGKGALGQKLDYEVSPRMFNQQALRSARRAASDYPIITEAPAGDTKTYKRAGSDTYVSSGSAYMGTQSGTMEIVFTSDNEVYMKNPVCGLDSYVGADAYVKGTLSGNTITVPLGQNLYYSSDYDAAIATCMADVYTSGSLVLDKTTTEITYTIDGETITQNGTSQGNALTCYWTDDDSWTGYSEWETVLTEYVPIPVVTPPAGLVTENWTIARYFNNGQSETGEEKVLQVGFDGNDVYVNGFSYYMDTDNWIKGTLSEDGKSITFASGQYYGALESQGEIYDLYFAGYDLTTNALAPVTVAYDALAGTMTWPETVLVLENGEEAEVGMYGYFTEIVAMVKGTAPEPLAAPDIVTTEWYFKSLALSTQKNEETGETETVVNDYNLHVQVGVGTNEIFVKGLCEDLPEAWIRGTLDPATNKVTFPTGQHFGTESFWGYEFPYYFAGYGTNGFEDVVMDYDATAKTLTMASPSYLLINAAWLLLDPNLILVNAQLQEIPEVAATPAQPEILESRLAGTSYPNITVNVPDTDKDGNPILTSKLAYQYFYKIGSEVTPLTLTTDLYTELIADMTEIPYGFSDGWDIYPYRLYLNMDFSGWDQIGIQSIYRGGGEENKSEIFWYDVYQPAPAEVTVAAGGDISAALAENAAAMKDAYTKPSDITINLAAGDYTISAPIEAAANVTIKGNGAKIDASALTGPFIVLDGTEALAPKADGTDSDHKYINSVNVSGVTITGLPDAFIKDNQKTLLEELVVDNSVIEMPASNKNFIDFNGKGYVGLVKVAKSTIWAKDKNTGFFAQYGSRPKNVNGDLLQQFDVQNSTIVNIANGKNFCDLKQNGAAQNVYTIKTNIFVDCGKQNQVVVGFNKGQASATPVWDVTGNSFIWNGVSVNEAEVAKAGQKDGEDIVKDCVDGDPGFKDAANGDFTLSESSMQRKFRVGDPRWFTEFYVPATVTDAIDLIVPANLGIMDGEAAPTDLYYFLESYLKDSENPAYIKLTLEPGATYVISKPLVVMTAIEIAGDAKRPASIFAYQMGANPFVQIKSDCVSVDAPNEKGFYNNIYDVTFKNFNLIGLKGQVFYANKMKYLIPRLTVDNCQFRMVGASNKTFFDFNGGGYVEILTINNSTLSADDATKWSNGGFFSTQSGTKHDDCGAYQQKFVLTNNTFYNVANGKTLSTLRENSKDFMSFEVINNVVVNSGKKGEFVKGLNAGQNNNKPSWIVSYNAFQWTTDNKTFEDISAKEASNADKCNVSGNVVGEIVFKYAVTDTESFTAILTGDYTLGDCAQKDAKTGDPRWLKDGSTGIQTLNAETQTEGAWYTLQGVRVAQPTKGVFIHNGKKVVVK